MNDFKDRAAIGSRGDEGAAWTRQVALVGAVGGAETDRLCRAIRYIANPAVLSAELRWRIAATGVTVDALRECLRLVESEARLARL
jgi:hypothetical protein